MSHSSAQDTAGLSIHDHGEREKRSLGEADDMNIRLLSLIPGEWHEEIRCEFRYVSLKDNPNFETLSYVWGDASITKTIILEKQEKHVTINLEAALRHLRDTEKSLSLWVDALCIDQDNEIEKMNQVTIMGEIYKSCTHCYFWLGCPRTYFSDEGSSLAFLSNHSKSHSFTIIEHLAADKCWSTVPFRDDPQDYYSYDYFYAHACTPLWIEFHALVHSDWWSRLWTLQEAAISPTATMVYGHSRSNWQSVLAAYRNLLRHRRLCCNESISKTMRVSTFNMFNSNISKVLTLHRTKENKAPTFREAQMHSVARACYDSRDKIYGLLSLFDYGKRLGIVPDYSLEPHVVYISAFRKTLEEYNGDLRPMFGFGFNSNSIGLPSWVPDFASLYQMDPNLLDYDRLRFRDQYDIYNAARHTKAKLRFGKRGRLVLSGVRAATIKETIVTNPVGDSEEFFDAILSILKFAGMERQVYKPSTVYDPRYEMFWRTIIADSFKARNTSKTRRASEDDFKEFEEVRSRVQNANLDHALFGKGQPFLTGSIGMNICGRSFFVTTMGSFGIGPPDTRPGDEVWVLHGGRVPFVLRPGSDQPLEDTWQLFHLFVGDCFLQGIMDGEALTPWAPTKNVVLH